MAKEKRIPAIRYVTLFPGRTGSTYLASHMMSHPEIAARYEILSRHRDSWESQLSRLKQLFEKKRFPVVKAVGFKTKISGVLDRKAFTEYLHENNFRIIHQVRNNHLKFIVSVIRAKMLRTKQGTSNVLGDEQKPLGPIEIPEPIFNRAKRRLNVVRRLQEYIDTLDLPKLKIGYEDLLADERGELGRIWDFLGVSPTETAGIIRKNTPDDIRKAVTNLDEILEHHPEMAKFVDQV